MSAELLEKGVEQHTVDGFELKIFTPARTVADCFKYRNKIGLDIAIEALREGWRDQRFTMAELQQCAGWCRVKNVMQPYLESLV